MRGTLSDDVVVKKALGITPAHAGNTGLLLRGAVRTWDHPRTCGEHITILIKNCLHPGSPPHMRGTRIERYTRFCAIRITPAHAGNTPIAFLTFCTGRDHPRTCGEHKRSMAIERIPSGSPPHMRGTRHSFRNLTSMTGITPAHAGNTGTVCRRLTLIQDHPRTCGEHVRYCGTGIRTVGSPPHMRGTPICILLSASANRITPAHAGNTHS